MITRRPSSERGHADHGWLDTYHTFSFADYYDPAHLSFRALRVINQDMVTAGNGFGAHAHSDMEIVTYVLEGALEHEDSMGNGSVMRPGDVQRMSAGSGVVHSEFNASQSERVRFLQIWIVPARAGTDPSYEQKSFDAASAVNRLRPIVTPDGHDGSLHIGQNVSIYDAHLRNASSLTHEIEEGRHAWLQVIDGGVRVNGTILSAGDGAAISDETSVTISADEDSHLLLFDLA